MRKILFSFFFFLSLFSVFLRAEENNTIIVCDNSMEMVEWDLKFLNEATQSVEISACYTGGPIIRRVLDVLEKRLECCPKLQVYILTTPILLEAEDKKILSGIEKKYPTRFHLEHASSVPIVWPEIAGVDNHVKMLVVDETYFSCGGTNLDHFCCEGTITPPNNNHPMGKEFPRGSRDQDVVGKGPLAKELRTIFYNHFALWKNYNKTHDFERNPHSFSSHSEYYPLEESSKAIVVSYEYYPKKIQVAPSQVKLIEGGSYQKKNAITQEYIRLINGAKDEILIANLLFCPNDGLLTAILNAVNRGVRITVITNGINERSPAYSKYFCWANRVTFVPLLYGKNFHFWEKSSCEKMAVKNSKAFEYFVEDIVLHKKVMIVDGKKFVVGSYNLGMRSDVADYEIILSFDSSEVATEAKKVFSKDLRHSLEVTPKEARHWYFDPFTSYLGEIQKKFHCLM